MKAEQLINVLPKLAQACVSAQDICEVLESLIDLEKAVTGLRKSAEAEIKRRETLVWWKDEWIMVGKLEAMMEISSYT